MNFKTTKERIIYESLRLFSEKGYDGVSMRLQIDGNNPSADVAVYENCFTEQLYDIGSSCFCFFAHDDYTKMYQKMLTIEQFHNPALAAEFSRQYYDGAIDYQKKLFGMLAEKGNFIEAANSGMTGCYQPCHNCIDNCIHTYAGIQLRNYCNDMMQAQGYEEPTGQAKITPACLCFQMKGRLLG